LHWKLFFEKGYKVMWFRMVRQAFHFQITICNFRMYVYLWNPDGPAACFNCTKEAVGWVEE
jgi:hypothetical protein